MLNRKTARQLIRFGAGAALGGLTLAVATAPAGNTAGPSFTRVQATFGQQVYTTSCQGCHGANLQGVRGPALVGQAFLSEWANGKRPAAELHAYIAEKMPRNKPASLTPAQYRNVTAYVLSKNGYPAGNRSLSAATLKTPLVPPPAR
ncbi:c-type cytochrome [Deinococcus budaensis]|uniref:Mono/diheme cytochrome c family protein n=1 Tax=Deinococcus budaensis TaxID=1665626 RepID=A0A7W8GEC1_9DEIO|nr:cytochrome c [Deinococcus budaensis]MBB5234000.1 mono/diheme cytochrome c family protein [Deinococcus budaensis]